MVNILKPIVNILWAFYLPKGGIVKILERIVVPLLVLLLLMSCSGNEENEQAEKKDASQLLLSESELRKQIPGEFVAMMEPLIVYRNKIVLEQKNFDRRATKNRIYYRVFGIILVICSVLIPYFSNSRFKHSKIVVSVLAILVAFITSIGAFFNWEGNWKGCRSADYNYIHEIRMWDIDVITILESGNSNIPKQLKMRTKELFINTSVINKSTSNAFFQALNTNGEEGI